MSSPQVTLAVVSLDMLAEPGGVLDNLVAAGFDVRGPRWKRADLARSLFRRS